MNSRLNFPYQLPKDGEAELLVQLSPLIRLSVTQVSYLAQVVRLTADILWESEVAATWVEGIRKDHEENKELPPDVVSEQSGLEHYLVSTEETSCCSRKQGSDPENKLN